MAVDKLTQVGKQIGKFQKETEITARYVSKNLPLVESSCDVLGRLYPYLLEFKIYNGGTAKLSIRIFQNLRVL